MVKGFSLYFPNKIGKKRALKTWSAGNYKKVILPIFGTDRELSGIIS